MSEKLTISKAEATAFTIDGIDVDLWWEGGTPGAYDKAVSTCILLQKVPKMIEALKLVYTDLTNKVRVEDGLTIEESEYNTIIGSLLKELEA